MSRNLNKIKYIVFHCTAGRPTATVADVLAEFKRKGWTNSGYHYLVTSDGKVHKLLSVDKIANGVRGYNAVSVHVAYTGVMPNDTQWRTLHSLASCLHGDFPSAKLVGHCDLNPSKSCPNFDVSKIFGYIK